MVILGPKPWVNPFGIMSIFQLFEVLVFIAQKGVFFVLEYRKRHFPGLHCLKRKVGKKVIFGPKPWVNPLGRMSIFRLFELLVFKASKGVFFVLEYRKIHFPGLCCLKRKVGKIAIFGPKPWVNPFGKVSIFLTFSSSCFYSQERRFFVLEYRKRHFPGLYCLKRNVGKMVIFAPKPWVNPLGRMSIFRLFELLVFIASKGVFFCSRIS